VVVGLLDIFGQVAQIQVARLVERGGHGAEDTAHFNLTFGHCCCKMVIF